MSESIEFCIPSCPKNSARGNFTTAEGCDGPIGAVDAAVVTGLRGDVLAGIPESQRTVCGKEWREPTEDDAVTVYGTRDPKTGVKPAITAYKDSADKVRSMDASTQHRQAADCVEIARGSLFRKAPPPPSSSESVLLRSVLTERERAEHLGGFEEDRHVETALAIGERAVSEVQDLLHRTLGRSAREDSLHALTTINALVNKMPELIQMDQQTREYLKEYLQEMGVHRASAMYGDYSGWADKRIRPFEPQAVGNEPTISVLKQRLDIAAKMLGDAQLTYAVDVANVRRIKMHQTMEDATTRLSGVNALHLADVTYGDIMKCNTEVNNLIFRLGNLQSQY